jgi:hypothetical protein
VLVLGGSDARDWQGKTRSAEIFDPRLGKFTPTSGLNEERFKLADAAALLEDGRVLVGGGNRQLELFSAESHEFTRSQQLDRDYYSSVLTLLRDGRVLISGGYDPDIQPTNQAWIYY